MISEIMPKNDNLNEHAIKVNYISRKACSKRNTGFLDNENLNPRYSCNRRKMDLNKKETNLLQKIGVKTSSVHIKFHFGCI